MELFQGENKTILIQHHDFWLLQNEAGIVDLGLDAINPDCLRMNWKKVADHMMYCFLAHPKFKKEIASWIDSISKEWETL